MFLCHRNLGVLSLSPGCTRGIEPGSPNGRPRGMLPQRPECVLRFDLSIRRLECPMPSDRFPMPAAELFRQLGRSFDTRRSAICIAGWPLRVFAASPESVRHIDPGRAVPFYTRVCSVATSWDSRIPVVAAPQNSRCDEETLAELRLFHSGPSAFDARTRPGTSHAAFT